MLFILLEAFLTLKGTSEDVRAKPFSPSCPFVLQFCRHGSQHGASQLAAGHQWKEQVTMQLVSCEMPFSDIFRMFGQEGPSAE